MEPQRIHLTLELTDFLCAYKTSPKGKIEIKEQIQNLLKAGLIKESCSPYSTAVMLLLKRENGKRTWLCDDFSKLNTITKTDTELLPETDTLLDKLANDSFHLRLGKWILAYTNPSKRYRKTSFYHYY